MNPKPRRPSACALLVLALAAAGAAALAAQATPPPQAPPAASAPEAAAAPSPPEPPFDEDAAVARIRAAIHGQEDKPAKEVFMWTETALGDLPAGRFLDVMQKGFARSLGVTCTHCHDPRSWDSEAKPQKEIARRMVKLVGAINDQLAAIPNLSEPRAHVGCATCHRGEVRPAGAPPPPAAPAPIAPTTPIAPTAPTAPAATPPPGSR